LAAGAGADFTPRPELRPESRADAVAPPAEERLPEPRLEAGGSGVGVELVEAAGTRNLFWQAGHMNTVPALASSTANFFEQLGQARRIMAMLSGGGAIPESFRNP
jgi:hypothetical protein